MTVASERLDLAGWRRSVSRMYTNVREAPVAGRQIAWNEWRSERNELFKMHAQSPLSASQRADFRFLEYFPYDPAWRFASVIKPDPEGRRFHYQLAEDGDFTIQRIGWATFSARGEIAMLALYWIEGYGGGLFLPFKDATGQITAGREAESYGGGRYLLDTIKGADLGIEGDRLVLDFNYAYNPSCAYHSRWVCPLAPAENNLSFPITAGEKRFRQGRHAT